MEIICDDPSSFRSLPPSDYAKTMATLAAASGRFSASRMSKTAFTELEVAIGFRHNPRQSEALQLVANPIEVATYGWVLPVLQGGILVAEIEALLTATSMPRDALQAFFGRPAACRSAKVLLCRRSSARCSSASAPRPMLFGGCSPAGLAESAEPAAVPPAVLRPRLCPSWRAGSRWGSLRGP